MPELHYTEKHRAMHNAVQLRFFNHEEREDHEGKDLKCFSFLRVLCALRG